MTGPTPVKGLTTQKATALTAEQVASILTRPLEQATAFLSAGPRIFDSAGPLRLPSAPVAANPDLAFTGEAELIPEHDPTFGEVTLLPSTMKSVKVITRYSNELARQSVVALEAALRDRLVRDVAAKLDKAAFSNAGDGIAEPMGMFKWAGVSTQAVAGKLTVDKLLAAQGILLAENVDPNNLQVFIRPEDYTNLRSEKATVDGRYQLQPDSTKGGVGSVLGMGVTISNHIPAGFGAVCDMSQIAVARDLAPSVMILTERYADYDEQAIRVVARYDWKPINPKGICTLTGITK
jgi:hypothetical protein